MVCTYVCVCVCTCMCMCLQLSQVLSVCVCGGGGGLMTHGSVCVCVHQGQQRPSMLAALQKSLTSQWSRVLSSIYGTKA